jgi:hypothetical protein
MKLLEKIIKLKKEIQQKNQKNATRRKPRIQTR